MLEKVLIYVAKYIEFIQDRKFNLQASIAHLIAFALPFCVISCNDETLISPRGYGLAFGFARELVTVPRQYLASIALLCVFASISVYYLKNYKQEHKLWFIISVIGFASLIILPFYALYQLKTSDEYDISGVNVSWSWGYYLSLFLFASIAYGNWKIKMKNN